MLAKIKREFKKGKESLSKLIHIMVKTYILIWDGSKKYMFLSFAFTIFSGILVPVTSIIWGRFINAVTDALANNEISNAIYWMILSVSINIIIGTIGYIKHYLSYMEAQCMNRYISKILFDKMRRVKVSAFDDSNFYNYVQKINNESVTRTSSIMQTSLKCVESIVSIISTLVIFIKFDFGIIIYCFLSCLPVLYINMKIAKKQYDVYNHRFEKLRYIINLKNIFTRYECVKELKVYRLHEFISNKILNYNDKFINEDKKIRSRFTIENAIADGVKNVLSGALKFLVLIKTIANRLQIGQFVTYIQLLDQLQVDISILFNVVQSFFEDGLYIDDLYRFLDDLNIEEKKGGINLIGGIQTIEFINVSFKYPGLERWVLKNISTKFCQGDFYALVGINGAGKTTFIKLILGLYEPTEGRILVNGIDLNQLNKESYFKMFATVFQDFIKYPFNVYENIGIGLIENIDNCEEIEQAGILSDIDSIIQRLPSKYNTKLLREWNEAVDLSHGQWQRIALSRAFFNKNANVVILDEPSSALDPEAEYNIFRKFEEISEHKMRIVISHRLSNIKKATCIILLKDGEIVGKGGHQDLYDKNEDYQKLYDMQAEGYV